MTANNQTRTAHRQQIDRMLRRKEVEEITGLSRSSIYAGMAAGTFPKSVKISSRAIAWPQESIRVWVAERTEGGQI